ncbi:MAG: hypothetical protein EOM50_04100 [Erysipelotrichia bacterium]|nr:hypothetical protein [Erysipelotrichia bacterium]
MNLYNLGHLIGIDKSIAYSSGARVVQALAGVGSIFFIGTFLSEIEQGYYFTFASILALQVFFELGLTGIMTQYVAHEAFAVVISRDGIIEGDTKSKSRLSSLLHFCVKWYTVISVLVFILLQVAGIYYFDKYSKDTTFEIDWFFPWLVVCLGTAVKLFLSPISSVIQGLGYVKEISEITFYQQIVLPLSTWIGLILGAKLYILGVSYLFSIVVWFVFVKVRKLDAVLVNLWKIKITDTVSYMKEIFPYQWKIALSWVSGYFIFNLFNPILFATEGAIVAGQMGMTLQAFNAISAFSLSWMNTKIPTYSKYIALRQYSVLDELFNRTLRQMVGICILLLILFFSVVIILRISMFSVGGSILGYRFLDYIPMLLMSIPILANQFINSWATYLRCHKQEPFLVNSIVMGILCLISAYFLGNAYGLYGLTIGYCVLMTFVSFPWAYFIYKQKKNKWHN